jgi:hypothetical protein
MDDNGLIFDPSVTPASVTPVIVVDRETVNHIQRVATRGNGIVPAYLHAHAPTRLPGSLRYHRSCDGTLQKALYGRDRLAFDLNRDRSDRTGDVFPFLLTVTNHYYLVEQVGGFQHNFHRLAGLLINLDFLLLETGDADLQCKWKLFGRRNAELPVNVRQSVFRGAFLDHRRAGQSLPRFVFYDAGNGVLRRSTVKTCEYQARQQKQAE